MESNSSPSIQPSSFTRKRYQKHPTQTSTSKLNLSVTLNPSDSASCSMTSAQNLKQKQLINTYGPNSAFKCRASCKTLEFSLIKDYFFEVSGTNLILTKSIDDHNLKNAEDTEREEKDLVIALTLMHMRGVLHSISQGSPFEKFVKICVKCVKFVKFVKFCEI